MIKATFNFYEQTADGAYNSDPCVYEATGPSKDVIDVMDIVWQAIEIEGFDNTTVLLEISYQEEGEYLDSDEIGFSTNIVRTDEPSEYIRWGDKKPHISKVDREKSAVHII